MIFNHLLAVYSPRILKNNIIQKGLSFFLRPFGLTLIDFITLNNITSNRWDGRLTYYLNKIDKYLAKEKIIFDVGSDRGQIIHFFLLLYNNCKIFGFEPNKSSYKQILNNLRNWFPTKLNYEIFNYALMNNNQSRQFYFSKYPELSSFYKINNDNNINKIEDVDVSTGDLFLKQKKYINEIDILKINTQGSELDVLKGFHETLSNSKIKIILCEFDYTNRYKNKNISTISKYEKFLEQYEYSLLDIVQLKRVQIKEKNIVNLGFGIDHGYLIFLRNNIIKDISNNND